MIITSNHQERIKMKKITVYVMAFLLAVSNAYAVDQEKPNPISPDDMKVKEAIEKTKAPPGKLLFYADIYEGYDNNVNLDSSRRGDIFTEADAQLGYKCHLTENVGAAINYYLNSVTYHKITDASFYDNSIALNLDRDLFGKTVNIFWTNTGEDNYYPNESGSGYMSYNSRMGIRNNINERFYHRLYYDFMYRDFPDRKSRDGDRVPRDSDLNDLRNGITYELCGLVYKDIYIKIKNQYYVNDSNEQFIDYYDYWAYRASVTAIMPLLTKRLYGLVGAGYQRTVYDSRQLVNDNTRTQKDNLYSAYSSIIFDVTKKTSISLNYIYRQNSSSEPSEKYSGSIISAGFHYAF